MCRKLMLLTSVVLALSLLNGASAVYRTWTNDGSDGDWCYYGNWSPDDVPTSADTAYIDQITYSSPNRGPIVGIGCNGDVGGVEGPNPAYGNTQVMDINTNGTFDVKGTWSWNTGMGTAIININGTPTVNIKGGTWRGPDDGVGILNISGDPTVVIKKGTDEDYDLRGGDRSGSFFINMSGGYLDVGHHIIFGDNGGGELNLSGGSINIFRNLALGELRGSAPVTVNVTGGSMNIGGKFLVPPNATRAGNTRVNLYAGVIDCNELAHGGQDDPPTYTDDWLIDIEQGVLKLKGDVKAAIDTNVAAEQITAYDGEGKVVVELVDGNTVVTALPPDPNTATNANPPNRSQNVDPNVALSWTPGINADSHDVYFGTSFDDVDNAGTADDVYMANVDVNHYPESGLLALELGTTYYWRIDAIGASQTWKGRVWHFTTRYVIEDPNMLVWYKFDEPNGNVATDFSGYGNHGGVDGNEVLWDPEGGHYDGCRIFDDDEGEAATVVDIPTTALSNIDGQITVAVWLKDNYPTVTADNWVFGAGSGGSTAPFLMEAAVLSAARDVVWRAGDDSNDVLRHKLGGRAGWHLFAFVKDESKDEMCIYFDGELANSRTGVDNTLANIRGTTFKVGATAWENYNYRGKMDNFRVYDKALSAGEVAALFRGGDITRAWAPSPGSFELDVPRDANLAWKPGNYAVSHDVYIGTNWDDVNDATTLSSVYIKRQDPCEYDPPSVLELEATYYWRIDEVNEANIDSPWKGNVWQFTVANFLIIDDMESYNQTDNWISDTWLDGFENESGAEVYVGIEPTNPAHGGNQSMTYLYYNDGGLWGDLDYYSEIEVDTSKLPIGSDWTDAGVKSLTLFFDGNSTNDANERMYAVLEDTGGTYAQVDYGYYPDEDMNDIKKEEWQQWNIALADFGSVDLRAVKKLYVGFGIRGNPNPSGTPGGVGIVYFDDVRLYLPRCVPSRLKPAADFTNDCKVDIEDVWMMAKQWLRTYIAFDEYTDPGTNGLVGWWKLDEGFGDIANDSSGYGNHGTISGSYWWTAGHENSAVEFSGGRIKVPDVNILKPQATVSASAWIYYSERLRESGRIVVKGRNDHEAYAIEVGEEDELGFYIGDVNGKRYFTDSNVGDTCREEWVHLAGTYDSLIVKSYVNGQLEGVNDVAIGIPLSQDACDLAIGNKPDALDNPFNGTIDDVRVYNRALSAAEVAWMASDGTGIIPLISQVNLYNKEPEVEQVINFRDYALLMDAWLDEKLWPPE